ncbi:MAG: hypothetical protein QG657_4278 [Acidobacteriota bacterium]|nr:hypothetical protein [Acidobacteriota bacterium]
MKIWLLILIIIIVLPLGIWSNPLSPGPETQIKYFRLDSIIKITGEVKDIKTEKCYKGDHFSVLYIKDQSSDRQYKVEVSPAWFFNLEVKTGKTIAVTGSYMQIGQEHIIMAQELELEGKIVNYRDRLGFPLWRGRGKMKERGMGNRRGRY